MTKPTRLLTVDIGNTSTTAGIYHRGRVSHVHRVVETKNRALAKSDVLTELAKRYRFSDVMVCSVVPDLNAAWTKTAKRWSGNKPVFLTNKTPMPVGIDFPKPKMIGADRLANACGAVVRYGAPCIVIDIGTALTFDVVDENGNYIGGVIGPGMPLMFDYMAEKTALLPHIEPRKLKRSIGKSTTEAMRIGAQLGCRGMVHEILKAVKRELTVARPHVVATGGYSKWVVPQFDKTIPIDADLTLLGLGAIHDYGREITDD